MIGILYLEVVKPLAELVFEQSAFTELENMQLIVMAYDTASELKSASTYLRWSSATSIGSGT